MGEMSEMIVDGILCCVCGDMVGDFPEDVGYPRPCENESCIEAHKRMMGIRKRKQKRSKNKGKKSK